MKEICENKLSRRCPYTHIVHCSSAVCKINFCNSFILGEKEGATKSLDSCQELLTESKSENAQLLGRVHAAESQIEGLKKGKEEVIIQPCCLEIINKTGIFLGQFWGRISAPIPKAKMRCFSQI